MARKLVFLVAALVLVSSGCGTDPGPAAVGGIATARPLAYSLTGDVALDYHVQMDMGVTTTFGENFRAIDPSMPASMDTSMEIEFDSSYDVVAGDEPGTYRVTLGFANMELGSGRVEMGSESFDFSDLPQGELNSILESQVAKVSYVIDEQGEVLSMEVGGVAIDVGGMLGGTSPAGSASGQMFGPQLPEGEVSIGATWTTTSKEQLPGMDPIVTEQTHTITGREDRNGYDTWVIRTESSTDGYTINWDDLVAMAQSLGGLSEIGIDESMPPAFQMSMRSAPTGTTTVTWFEPDLGLTIAQDMSANIAMTIEMGGLPNTRGRSVSVAISGYTHSLMELK